MKEKNILAAVIRQQRGAIHNCEDNTKNFDSFGRSFDTTYMES